MDDKNFHLVLYRKYRPQNFSEIIGQDHIVGVLKNAVGLNQVAHSHLFAGPKGTGKTSLARILAKAINCRQRQLSTVNYQLRTTNYELPTNHDQLPTTNCQLPTNYEPCNQCDSCEEITDGRSLDLIEIDAASNRGIDEIRQLKEAARLCPFKNPYRVYIIDEVHMLTKEAFNALLKILEEPPKHVVFILATTEDNKIPETVKSRCQEFKFRKLSEQLIRLSLRQILEKEEIKTEDGVVDLLSFLADGSLRDGHSHLEQIINFEGREIKESEVRAFFGLPAEWLVHDFLRAIFEKNPEKCLEVIKDISAAGLDSRLFVKLLLRNVRLVLLLGLAPKMESELANQMSKERLDFLKGLKTKTNPGESEFALKVFLDAYYSPSYSYLPELPLEIAVARILGGDSSKTSL